VLDRGGRIEQFQRRYGKSESAAEAVSEEAEAVEQA